MDLSYYLGRDEAMELERVFTATLKDSATLVFWTGIPSTSAAAWAEGSGLKTLTMAMGPLYTDRGPTSIRKRCKSWPVFMKGASGVFAQHACRSRCAVVLTRPPPNIYSSRLKSNYREIEEPILKGVGSELHTMQIDYVHPGVPGAEHIRYQKWPVDRSIEWFRQLYAVFIVPVIKNVMKFRSCDQTSSDHLEVKSSPIKVQDRQSFVIRPRSGKSVEEISAEKPEPDRNVHSRAFQAGEEGARIENKNLAKLSKVERAQQSAQEKKLVKKQRQAGKCRKQAVDEQMAKQTRINNTKRKVEGKKLAKRSKAEGTQRETQERKAAGRLEHEENQRRAIEQLARRRKDEEKQRKVRKIKLAKQLKPGAGQQKAQKRELAKRQKVEEEKRQAKKKHTAKHHQNA